MRDLDLTTLRLFVTVCETRNMARAAERVHMVGSAISKRLAQLEETVGTPLLQRRRHGVEPTPAGQTLLEHARDMLAGASRIERDMSAYAAGVKGQVRILATASVLAESLADDVATFLQHPEHAAIRVDMEERVSPEVIRGVREGSAALGICWDAADLSGLVHRTYRRDHLVIVAHASHPLAAQRQLSFVQALEHEFVSMPPASAVQVMLQREAALTGQPLRHRVVVSNFESALRVVRANLAVSVVPREVVQPLGAQDPLRLIELTDAWAERRFAVCCREPGALPRAAQLLFEHLSQAESSRS